MSSLSIYFYFSYPQGSLFVKSIPVRGVPVGGSRRDASDRTRSILGKGFPLVAPHSSSNMSKKISSLWKMKEDLCRLTLRKLMLSCLFSHLVFSVMERDGSWQVRSARHIIHQLDSMPGWINKAIVWLSLTRAAFCISVCFRGYKFGGAQKLTVAQGWT